MFGTLQKNVTTSGTPVQLSSGQGVMSGLPILIRAKATNTDIIALGNSSANALRANGVYFSLSPGEAVEVRIENLSQVWIDSVVNGEGIEVLFEPIV